MHPVAEQGSSSVPAFLTKLWTLVEDPATNEFICWDASGKSFHVCDQGRFSKEVLPMYFKHSNIASFIRQLNMYGFRKVVGIESGGLKVEKDDMEFAHPYFQRDKENLLEYIKRKRGMSAQVPNMKSDEMKVKHDDVHRVLTDVRHMKGKQDNLSSKLDQLKRENELLWLEVASLRQKHMKQQQIVNKLIQFLVSLVGNRGVKRKMPLMLNDASQLAAKKARPRGRVTLEGKQFQPEESPGQSTLSIHDVTDQLEGADVLEHLAGPSLGEDVIATIEEPNILLEEAHLGTDALSLGGEASAVNQDQMSGEPKDILDVLSEQSEILSIPTTSQETAPHLAPVESPGKSPFVTVAFDDIHGAPARTSEAEVTDRNDNTPFATCMDAVLGSAAVREDSPSAVPQTSVVPSVPADPKTLQRSNSHPVELEMSDHLDGLQTDLDALKDLLAGGQYTFEPGTILNLFDLGSSILVDQPSTSSADSDLISGNEVVQYNPPEDISTLFDLGDLTSSTPLDEDSAEAALQEMVTQGQDSTLNTPLPIHNPESLFPPRTSTTTSTEEVD